MRSYCDRISKERGMNYTLIATPAEGLSGRFVRIDRERYGVIPGVTDRDYYTNGFHVPVYFDISAFDKIRPGSALPRAHQRRPHQLHRARRRSVRQPGGLRERHPLHEGLRHGLRLGEPPGRPRSGVRLQRHHRATSAPSAAAPRTLTTSPSSASAASPATWWARSIASTTPSAPKSTTA